MIAEDDIVLNYVVCCSYVNGRIATLTTVTHAVAIDRVVVNQVRIAACSYPALIIADDITIGAVVTSGRQMNAKTYLRITCSSVMNVVVAVSIVGWCSRTGRVV